MTREPKLGQYTLLVLNGMLHRSASLPELQRAIAAHAEDSSAEASSIEEMRRFVAACGDAERVRRLVQEQIEEAGGLEYLQSLREQMDFDEFLYGWGESEES